MRRHCWPAYRKFLQSTTWPILAGPWRSELGFECLYWIPFLQACGIDPKRIIPITRGGAGAFYGSPSAFELYAMRDPKAIRIENIVQHGKTKSLKQYSYTAFDKQIITDAAKEIGLTKYHVLHPAWMYHALEPYWDGRCGLEWVFAHLTKADGKGSRSMSPIPVPPLPEGVELPKGFVAARFYFRSTFAPNEQSIVTTKETIKQLAKLSPVILLDSGIHADEHADVKLPTIPNVHKLTDLLPVTAENNLALQAAVMGRAQGFVGTYGGLAQLALRLGKPTISFYQKWEGTSLSHKYLADALATAMQIPCIVLRIGEIPLVKTVIPALQLITQRSGSSGQPAFVPRAQPTEPELHAH